MKKNILILVFICFTTMIFAQVELRSLTVENLSEPIGIQTKVPRFSWKLTSKKRDVKQTAYENGALGSGISGSGPSIFALSKGKETADKIAKAMSAVYDEMNLPYEIHVSKVNDEGMKIIS